MSQYQQTIIDNLKAQREKHKASGFNTKGIDEQIAEMEELKAADDAARARRLSAQKDSEEAKAKAREEAEDARLIPLIKPEWMSQPGATEADFKRQWPWIKAAHVQRTQKANDARIRAAYEAGTEDGLRSPSPID